MNIAERAGQAGGAVTLGALVHNPDVVGRLERAGVKVVHELEEAAGRTVIVPSHGLPPQTIRSAEAMGLTLVDATCPHVLKAQLAAARAAEAGRTVVIVGDAEHPEVKAVAAHAGDHVHVVDGPAALDEIGIREGQPVTVLAQTTQVASLVEAVVEKARHMGGCRHVNTVCPATAERQRAAADLAGRSHSGSGGKASANTMDSRKYAASKGVPVLKVERSSELDASALRGARLIGVTAGASTPSWSYGGGNGRYE